MKILFVAAEVAPYSTVGGLSQVIYFLAQSLIKQGHDVRIFTAKYGTIKPTPGWKEAHHHIKVPTGYTGKHYDQNIVCNVLEDTKSKPRTYFLENQEYYELRSNVYGYKDDHIRFFLLSRGCLEWLREQKKANDWVPDMVHIHDWHTSYVAEDMRTNPRYKDLFKKIPLLLTVHNFHMQGPMDYQYLHEDDRDEAKSGVYHFFHKDLYKQNPLLRGIIYSDWVNTVSQNHVNEILTKEYGEGLEEVLMQHRGKLSGILNGIDTSEFNPQTDPLIKTNFSLKTLKLRAENKEDLQKTFGLPVRPDVPVLGFVGRLAKQKGIDMILQIIEPLVEEYDVQFVFLGTGEAKYRRAFMKLAERYPDQIKVHLYPNFKLPRKIFSGADILLVPSIFEPGGIVAIEGLRYGAISLVRQTGGLADIVQNFDPATREGNGLSFREPTEWGLFAAIVRGITLYKFPAAWKQLVVNALKSDFSWDKVASEYADLYGRVSRKRKRFLKSPIHPSNEPSPDLEQQTLE